MRAFSCHCGAELSATETATLVGPVHGHFAGAHPEYGLTPVSVRNYLEAEDRARRALPDLADEIIDFFDHDLFPDNPAWASCHCMFYFLGGEQNPDWGNQPWREVRQAQRERISTGRTTGVVAYSGDRPAGWCNATARSEFPSHRRGDDDSVCSIVCFAVALPIEVTESPLSCSRERCPWRGIGGSRCWRATRSATPPFPGRLSRETRDVPASRFPGHVRRSAHGAARTLTCPANPDHP